MSNDHDDDTSSIMSVIGEEDVPLCSSYITPHPFLDVLSPDLFPLTVSGTLNHKIANGCILEPLLGVRVIVPNFLFCVHQRYSERICRSKGERRRLSGL